MRILISGHKGRMGQQITSVLTPQHTVIGHHKDMCLKRCILQSTPDLIVDVTVAQSVKKHIDIYLAHKIPVIVATSGLLPNEAMSIANLADFPLLITPNLSVGFSAFFTQAITLAQKYPPSKIIETHHSTKADSPSATSLYLAHHLKAPIQSLRVDHYIAKHEIIYSAHGDHMALSHTVTSPKNFMGGLLKAITYIQTISNGEVRLNI